jgi:hypothetical protein
MLGKPANSRPAVGSPRLRRGGWIVLAAGILLIGAGWQMAQPLVALHRSGLRAQGIVQGVERGYGSRTGAYYPRVSFTATDGSIIRFRDGSGANPPAYRVGDRVIVLYLAGDSRSAIIDGGIRNWRRPLVVASLGLVLVGASLIVLRRRITAD